MASHSTGHVATPLVAGDEVIGATLARKKLIEVALPLDAINEQSAREKSIRRGHPSTLHLWWSRKPTATARAVLFAQLVDDPSEREAEFRAEAGQLHVADVDAWVADRIVAERDRLFELIKRIVDWDNLNDEAVFAAARDEIHRSCSGQPPAILDPFAGGGTIPLEAQRLGLEAHASDLNPVAVLINMALIEIPPRFAGMAPVHLGAAESALTWEGASGLAEDVRRYGSWMRDEAQSRIGHLYPKADLPDGGEANVIAWIWARTVTCPNPACGIETPLASKWWLGKKKGKEAYVVPTVVDGRVEYSIGHTQQQAPKGSADGTVGRNGATCVACGATVELAYVRTEGAAGRLGAALTAVVAENGRSRLYLPPRPSDIEAARVEVPANQPVGQVPERALGFRVRAYGMNAYSDLFTSRQLTALTTFSDLVMEARELVLRDARAAGLPDGTRLEEGGDGAEAYADAVATFLGLCVSRMADMNNSLASWSSSRDQATHLFTRQAIPMTWDFAEVSPFGRAAGDPEVALASITSVLRKLPCSDYARSSRAEQIDATSATYSNLVISTDPPYYDNIGYSDLSDFFYVWLRRSLRPVFPQLFSTVLVPKSEELVANPYRHGGKDGAREFFEHGFEDVFVRARASANPDYPITVYYAFKQSELDPEGQASTGWETILASMIRAGWEITATWPMRSERGGRMLSIGTNALASSIVLALRPRPEEAPATDRRGLTAELRSTLPEALREMQSGGVAPVDLAQAAIGPGMAVFSRYSRVIEADGRPMPVREALRQINAVLSEVLSEQDDDFDADTRWCLAWYENRGFAEGPYGEAETLANAKNASIDGLRRGGVVRAAAGKVALLAPTDLPAGYDPRRDDRISLWEVALHLARTLSDEHGGIDAAGRVLHAAETRDIDSAAVQQLAYQLYAISERHGWTSAGVLFNALGSSWPEVRAAARAAAELERQRVGDQGSLDLDELG